MISRWAIAAVLVVALVCVGCGPDTGPETGPDESAAFDGLSGELVITRQRDLLDRGLINVMVTNDTDTDITVLERALVASNFDIDAAPRRRSLIPSGRVVALQVPYGSVSDCAENGPVDADLRITVAVNGSATEVSSEIDLGGTEILEAIRAEHCATLLFDSATDVKLTDVVIDGRELTATIRVVHTSGRSSFEIQALLGTILIGVEPTEGSLPVEVDGQSAIRIPVTFAVNRCDPHALAEITKRFGLDLVVAIDGGEPQPIAIDVTELVPSLELIVDRCSTATIA